MMRPVYCGLTAGILAVASANAQAPDLRAEERFSDTAVRFELPPDYTSVTLSVLAPDGAVEQAFARRGSPSIDLRQRFLGLRDGLYSYQLTAATQETVRVTPQLDDGRGDRARPEERVGVTVSGTFQVRNGVIVPAEARPEREVRGGAAGDDQDR